MNVTRVITWLSSLGLRLGPLRVALGRHLGRGEEHLRPDPHHAEQRGDEQKRLNQAFGLGVDLACLHRRGRI